MKHSSPKMLVVDDDAAIHGVIEATLRAENIQIVSAYDGAHALSRLGHGDIDLVLLDLGLPDMHGFDILRATKAHPGTLHLPVIVLTARDNTEDKLKGFQLGAVDYITKPCELLELRARVRSTLRTKFLQDELARANHELEVQRRSAESALRVKAEFLANMSHEIRTPMNGVIAMTSLLLETELTGHQREIVETVRTSGDTLLTLINDILDFSKIEAGRLELENQPFDLRLCMEDALDLLASKAQEKSLELAYQVDEIAPSAVVGDVTRLRQILVNLVSNAIKFTTTGEVIMRLGISTPDLLDPRAPLATPSKAPAIGESCLLHFSVSDTGIGIPPEKVSRLFKSFSQVDASVTRQFGGTGLGLAISRNLAELMGGRMWVDSIPGKGSTFHFTVRGQVAAPVVESPTQEAKARLANLRVLLVDDNPTNRRILVLQTTSWGMKPVAASAGNEALEWLKAGEHFDLAILDMQMPAMDGLMLAAEVRKLRTATQLPMVLLTSMGVRADAPELAIFAASLSKPVKQTQLQEVLLRTVDKTRLASKKAAPASKLDSAMSERVPLRLLVVDDNAINQKVALRLFQQMGYQADVASNGFEAFESVQRKSYDMVFMDVQMPEMDGLEATRRIRAWERSKPEPRRAPVTIIAMTANAMQGDREKCIQAGMNDYLPKPVRPEALQKTLEQWGGAVAVGSDRPSVIPAVVVAAGPVTTAAAPKPAGGVAPVKTAVVAPPVNNHPPVDMDRLSEFTSNDPESLSELITLYCQQTTDQLTKLRTAIGKGIAEDVRKVAHSCAGSSATCGMNAIVPSLRELERISGTGSLQGAAGLIEQADAEFERIRQFLAQKGALVA